MNAFVVEPQVKSQNAKVGAVALAAGAFLTLLLSHFSETLAPIRLLSLALSAFAAWSFCDEMGMRKPLNRAGFVFFAIAVMAKVQLVLGVATDYAGRFYLLYAAFLLAAQLFWSVAFLHRQRQVRVVGTLGVLASLTPIAALVIGHLALSAGAFLGVGAMLSAAEGAATGDYSFVMLVERLFGLWCYLAAWLLWRGQIQFQPMPE